MTFIIAFFFFFLHAKNMQMEGPKSKSFPKEKNLLVIPHFDVYMSVLYLTRYLLEKYNPIETFLSHIICLCKH